jgi:hypothetical protein
MAILGRSLYVLAYSESKVGKTTLCNTAPAPRLILDAEMASRFLPGNQVRWNPHTDPPPTADGTWETCIVMVREYATMLQVMRWLESGQHPFESLCVDSISEIQKRLRDQVTDGTGEMDQKRWGDLLMHMEALIRKLRDLTEHPIKPLTAVVITAMMELRDGKWRPLVQGALRDSLPYFVDICGYMFVQQMPTEDPTQPGPEIRRILTRPNAQYIAGERVQGRIPQFLDGPQVDISVMLDMVFGPLPVPESTTPAQGQ